MECWNCGSKEFFFNRETMEVVCRRCGYVVDTSQRLVNLPVIEDQEEKVIKLSPRDEIEARRMGRWLSIISREAGRKGEKVAINVIRICDALHLSRIVMTEALRMCRSTSEISKGRSAVATAAALVYLACRVTGSYMPLKDISDFVGVRRRDISRIYKRAARELGLRLRPVPMVAYIRAMANKVGAPDNIRASAERIASRLSSIDDVSGKNPVVMASATILYAMALSGHKINIKRMAHRFGVTEPSLRRALRIIERCAPTSS